MVREVVLVDGERHAGELADCPPDGRRRHVVGTGHEGAAPEAENPIRRIDGSDNRHAGGQRPGGRVGDGAGPGARGQGAGIGAQPGGLGASWREQIPRLQALGNDVIGIGQQDAGHVGQGAGEGVCRGVAEPRPGPPPAAGSSVAGRDVNSVLVQV
ncbi:hypothetical protein H696_05202 [Fonticula alba]|uniref:Uncharacterized protein n=1 Tax=Fonticula alba TaxID=691883 RepID=A0A058Z422_FONAL|nr:hypothetical protein H696_05202 [Fonticula alba]KCV68282.1 hypothetical protein H696_05202 [Fonticula alba]|eukprot:XP_009497336.1 hypothetical protein H696_05202 [Fonticula alba]